MFAAFVLAAAAAASAPVPAQEDVRQALADELASRCGDDDACIARQPATSVRALSCRSEEEGVALCRYESRTGTAAWRAGETRFRFDVETELWFIDAEAR
jgi:hypothetical protein